MNYENYQSFLLPLIIIIFFAHRMYRAQIIKKQLPKLLKEGAIIIDVRSKAEFSGGHAPSSLNIPLDNLQNELGKIDKSKTVLLCCASGARSGMAMAILKKNGFKSAINAGRWSNLVQS